MPNRRQAITWAYADPVHWCIYAALGGDEFMSCICLPLGMWKGTDCQCPLKIGANSHWWPEPRMHCNWSIPDLYLDQSLKGDVNQSEAMSHTPPTSYSHRIRTMNSAWPNQRGKPLEGKWIHHSICHSTVPSYKLLVESSQQKLTSAHSKVFWEQINYSLRLHKLPWDCY